MAELSEREKLVGRNLITELEEAASILDDCEDLDLRDAVREAAAYIRSEPERLAAVRNEAIEECARLVDRKNVYGLGNTAYDNAYDDATKDIAAAIRSLKEPQ